MGTIYVAIIVFTLVVIAIGTGFFIYNNKNDGAYSRPKAEPPRPKAKAPEPKPSAAPSLSRTKKSAANDSRETLDQQYADKNRMWVCKYCETLNSYPEGVAIPVKKEQEMKKESQEALSGLKGDLFHKATTTTAPGETAKELPVLYCAACGKQL